MRSKIIYFFLTAMILLSIPSNKAFAAEDNLGNGEQTVMSSTVQPREILTYEKRAWTEDNNVRVVATITVQGSSMTIIGIQNAHYDSWNPKYCNIVVGPATVRDYGAFATVTVTYEDKSGNIYTSYAYIYP